uniref:NADH-ubiquinone oxidoreductase chain 1 n=1 Tax=Sulcionema specki TaxID=2016126 RepID=A0A6G5ZV64_9EUGL|nr:NADH dehydrogenase subunit 1 [Sulcionema specki]
MLCSMLVSTLLGVVILLVLAVVVSMLDRRTMASVHQRDGPISWGVLGVVQPIVDGAKLFIKGTPNVLGVHPVLLVLSTAMLMAVCVLLHAMITITISHVRMHHNYMLVFMMVVLTLHTILEILSGVLSLSRYAYLTVIRIVVLALTIEILWLVMLLLCYTVGSLSGMHLTIVSGYSTGHHPFMVCILFMIVMMEVTIHPYDVVECEPEMVCGYYVDYGGVYFTVIYLVECFLMVVLWLLLALSLVNTGGGTVCHAILKIWMVYIVGTTFRWSVIRYRMDMLVGVSGMWILYWGNALLITWMVFFFF